MEIDDVRFLPTLRNGTTPLGCPVSWCRCPVAVPGEYPRRRCAFVPRRPLPLAPLAVSATGGARVAPRNLTSGSIPVALRNGTTPLGCPVSWCRCPVAVPGEYPRRRCAFVPRRPLPLAPLAVSATGGARVAPRNLTSGSIPVALRNGTTPLGCPVSWCR